MNHISLIAAAGTDLLCKELFGEDATIQDYAKISSIIEAALRLKYAKDQFKSIQDAQYGIKELVQRYDRHAG